MDLETYTLKAFQDYLYDVEDGHMEDLEFKERKRDAESRCRNGEQMRLPETRVHGVGVACACIDTGNVVDM